MLTVRRAGALFVFVLLQAACDGAPSNPVTANGGAGTPAGGAGAGGGASGGAASGGVVSGASGALASGGVGQGGASGAASGGTISGGGQSAGAMSGGTTNGGTVAGGAGAGGQAGNAGAGGSSAAYRPCPTDGACKIMPFGDSITDGFGTDGAYRVELFRLAHQAGKNISFVGSGSNGPAMVDGVAFPPKHEGHSGFTIAPVGGRSGISPLVASVMPQYAPHIVTLMIGTNDAIDDYEMANAPTRLGALIDSIFTQLPNVLIVLAQPIPSQDDALNLRLQTYNAALPALVKARVAAGRHLLLVDMYTPFSTIASYKTTLLKDTWHPNEAGHVILGGRWYAALAASL